MKRVLNIFKILFKWILIIAFALVVILIIFVQSFDDYLGTEKGIRWMFSEVPHEQFEVKFTPSGIRYLSIGDASKPALLMVHGAPGSVLDWLNFASHERIYKQYRLLLADRPAYGGTKLRKPEPSIERNAELMLEVIASEPDSSVTVLGHSYGAPIAVIMGSIAPQKIKRIIASSGQYDPDNEIVFGISHLIKYRIFRYLIPYMFWVSNEEKMAHSEACKAVLPLYPSVQPSVHLIHGNADGLVYYENSPYLQNLLTCENKLVTLEGFGHFLPGVAVDFLVDFAMDEQTEPPFKLNVDE